MSIWVDAYGWPIPPTVLLGCLVAEILYFRGWHVLIKAEQAKRSSTPGYSTAFSSSASAEYQWSSWSWRGIYFLAGIITVLLASSAPIDTLSSRYFWVHMIQHLLLLIVIAPLFVAGAPLLPLWLGLPRWTRRLVKKLKVGRPFYQIGKFLRHPVVSCVLLIIGIWIWHWPPLYDLALTNAAIHDWCEHATFIAVSFLFWTQVISSPPLHPRLGYLGRIGCVGIAIAQNIALAMLIAFAQAPLYAPYAHLAQVPGGLSALLDQHLGAGIMWTFGDLPFAIALAVLVHQWLTSQSDDLHLVDNTMTAVNSHHDAQREALLKTGDMNVIKSASGERN